MEINVNELRDKYVNQYCFVKINDSFHPFVGYGFATHVDDVGTIHGTWCGLGVVLPVDSIEIANVRVYKYHGYFIVNRMDVKDFKDCCSWTIYDSSYKPVQLAQSLAVAKRIINVCFIKKED
mgnify:CR=1 FL=1